MTDPQSVSDRLVTRELSESYDALPYESEPLNLTHPDCLATAATLLGMVPPPVDSCRVLELGCASGMNLMAMAVSLPRGHFLGVDVSTLQITRGREVTEALGLDQVDLRTMDLSAVGPELGEFDYIICHGVYSWVPPSVQDAILSVCRQHLAPHGVAFVSYNVYPGWHFRKPVRDFLRSRVCGIADLGRRVEIARDALELLVRWVDDPQGWYAASIESEAALLAARPDAYLAHEHLDAINEPVYFHEFVERATEKGLRYLCEASRQERPEDLSCGLRDALGAGDLEPVELEQTLDFLRNRMFRTTLLCRTEVVPDAAPRYERVRSLFADSIVTPVADTPELRAPLDELFRGPDDVSVTSNDPLVKATLMKLYDERPRAIAFDTLLAAVCSCLAGELPRAYRGGVPEALARVLLQLHSGGGARLHVHPFDFTVSPSERPIASPLARYQAKDAARVVNLKHEPIQLVELDRVLLSRLDGSRDRADLTRELAHDAAAGRVRTGPEDDTPASADVARGAWRRVLDNAVERLAQAALLIE